MRHWSRYLTAYSGNFETTAAGNMLGSTTYMSLMLLQLVYQAYGITKIHFDETNVKPIQQLWRSTGFCPPSPHDKFSDYIRKDVFKQNMAMIASLPYKAQSFQVRIHWLLDLVSVSDNGGYNFSHLDEFMNSLYSSGLSVGFELMGNPGNRFSDFENVTQVEMWYQLIYQTVKRYQHMHKDWNYESWNEPDHGDFDGLKFSEQGYLNYFDACEKGVHDVDPQAKFGGPGASCRLTKFSKLCWELMDHVTGGINYFSKEKGTRLDYISFHKKGGKRGMSGNSTLFYQSELETLQHVENNYKTLANVSVYNDEGDPVTGWDQPMTFRADTRYPSMVLRLIHMHLYSSDPEFANYRMTSNDNAFISYAPHYFTQRTMLAAFAVNNTAVPYSVLIRKPIYELMAMLSQVRGEVIGNLNRNDFDSLNGCILSRGNSQVAVTCWLSNDTNHYTGSKVYRIVLPQGLIDGSYVIRELNDAKASAYDTWKWLGCPGNLSQYDTEVLWNTTLITATKPKKTPQSFDITISGTGIAQVIACKRGAGKLTVPHSIIFINVTVAMVMITWEDEEIVDCFFTYELEFRRLHTGSFSKINNGILLTRSYQYTSKFGVAGDYRVRSKDIMGQTGQYSITYHYQSV